VRDRQAGQRARRRAAREGRIHLPSRGERALRKEGHDGVQRRIDAAYPADVRLHDFGRRHGTLAHEPRQLVRGKEAHLVGRQNSPLCSSRSWAF